MDITQNEHTVAPECILLTLETFHTTSGYIKPMVNNVNCRNLNYIKQMSVIPKIGFENWFPTPKAENANFLRFFVPVLESTYIF